MNLKIQILLKYSHRVTGFLSIITLMLGTQCVSAEQSELSTSLTNLTNELVSSYQKNNPLNEKEKIVVFQFSSSKELEAKRVGFAVSELLAHIITKDSNFIVMERMELNQLFKELKLNMSGAVSPDDALKAGKIGGAKIAVCGSMEKIGSKYHITARIVDVETSQVLSTAHSSVPVQVFEEEAKEYIVHVPEVQKIGIYLLYNWRWNSNSLPAQTLYKTGSPLIINPHSFNLPLGGVGLRYAPSKNALIDFAVMHTTQKVKVGRKDFYSTLISDEDCLINATVYRGLLWLKTKTFLNLTSYLGAGFTTYPEFNYITPTLQFRAEYLPQSRIGISISAGYDLINKESRQYERLDYQTGISNKEVSHRAKLDKFYIEPSISVYF